MSNLQAKLRPTRVKTTWVTYFLMGAYGAWVYAFGATRASLTAEQGISLTVAGLYGTAIALGLVVMSGLNARVAGKLGRGGSMRLGSFVVIAGILVITSGLPFGVTLVGTFIAACGGALAVSGVSAFVSAQQGLAAPAALSEASALAAIASFIGPVVAGIGIAIGWGWRPALWTVALCFLVVEIFRGRSVRDYDGEGETRELPSKVRDLPKLFWWTALTMLPAVGIEYCLALWSTDYLKERGGLGGGAEQAALVSIVIGLLIGRVVGSRFAERMNPERLLIGAFALSGLAFLVVWSIPNVGIMLLFLVITGCGVGLHWPLAIGRSIRSAPRFADRASGTGTMAAGVAVMIAPFALGALADGFGLQWAFLIVPALALLGVALVVFRPVPMLVSGTSE